MMTELIAAVTALVGEETQRAKVNHGKKYASLHEGDRRNKFQRKQDMHGLFTPKNKYGPPAILCHLCESCFLQLLDELEVSL